MILVELNAAINAAGTEKTFYVSTDHFVTSPTDTPAHTAFHQSLIDPGYIGLHVVGDGRTTGAAQLEIGEIIIGNNDGAYDDWINYSFDNRAVIIRSGHAGPYPAAFTTLAVLTVDSVEVTFNTLIFRLRSKQYLFAKPLLTSQYAGSNMLPDGVDGAAGDIKGRLKPRIFGIAKQISPPLVNTAKLVYQCNDGAVSDIAAVYDKGAPFVRGVDVATSAALLSASPAAGSYITCLAAGLFRLGSTPAGTITADVTTGQTSAAAIIGQIATMAGLAPSEINQSDLNALASRAPAPIGIYLDAPDTAQDVLDRIAGSIGAWTGFDALGVLRMGQIAAPDSAPVMTLNDWDIGSDIERRVARDIRVPVWRVTLTYARYWTTQTSDLAGSVSAATRAALAEPTRSVTIADASVQTQWRAAIEINSDTLLATEADANTEAARLLALYKVRRDQYEVTMALDAFNTNLQLMDIVTLKLPRFGLSGGKPLRVVSRRLQLTNNRLTLTLWG